MPWMYQIFLPERLENDISVCLTFLRVFIFLISDLYGLPIFI